MHGELACVDCHGGLAEAKDKESAHEGVLADPSTDPNTACGECHQDIVDKYEGTFHAVLLGHNYSIETRAGYGIHDDPVFEAGWEKSCNNCHATCGSCHVSRPKPVEGGLVSGHVFRRTPHMKEQCMACHGSRVGDEYRGLHTELIPGYKGDVHYLAGMRCESCHTAEEMHGGKAIHRFAYEGKPRCEDCHSALDDANQYHAVHLGDMQCQVCHSQDYKSCRSCHVPDGLDEPSWLAFKIGLNPLPDSIPEQYVTLRHIPIAPDTYVGWGEPGEIEPLASFEGLPTWKNTAPHTIRRWTARTELAEDGDSCFEACHNSPATLDGWFLRQVDLDADPDVAAANQPYIVPDTIPTEW